MSTDQQSDQNQGDSASIRAAELNRLRQQSEADRSVAGEDSSSSHAKLIVVVSVAMLAVVLALLSAFVWPGWALNKTNRQVAQSAPTSVSQPTTPSIKAKDLPAGSTPLLKAMPDSVLDFARTDAKPSEAWSAAVPLEEYALTYATGKSGGEVTLRVAQWSDADEAKEQYDALTKAMGGKGIAAGDVKVSDKVTGSYVVKADGPASNNESAKGSQDASSGSDAANGKSAASSSDSAGRSANSGKATALWCNDTVLFQATGSQTAVQRFYEKFPL